MQTVKVLHLGKYDAHGGIERHVRLLATSLTATGQVSVTNVVANNNAKTDSHNLYGYQTVRAASFGNLASVALSPTMPLLVRHLHQQERFDLVHLHFPDPLGQLCAIALGADVPRVITWHSDIIRQRLAVQLYKPWLRSFVNSAKAIIAATPKHFSSSTQLPRTNSAQYHVVPYAFDPTPFRRTQEGERQLELLLAQRRGRPVIFSLGRHVYYKGFNVLIEAMQTIDALLWIGGSGPCSDALRTQISALGLQDKVQLVGSLSDEQLWAFYQAADVFCLPSTHQSEAFGLVQLEAMHFGLPVVSCLLGTGVEWVNQDERTGLLVPPNNPKALSVAINRLLTNAELRKQLGQNGQQRVVDVFSVQQMVDATLTIYRQALSK